MAPPSRQYWRRSSFCFLSLAVRLATMRLYAALTSLSPQKPSGFRCLLAHVGEQYCLVLRRGMKNRPQNSHFLMCLSDRIVSRSRNHKLLRLIKASHGSARNLKIVFLCRFAGSLKISLKPPSRIPALILTGIFSEGFARESIIAQCFQKAGVLLLPRLHGEKCSVEGEIYIDRIRRKHGQLHGGDPGWQTRLYISRLVFPAAISFFASAAISFFASAAIMHFFSLKIGRCKDYIQHVC